jgi:SAM-dependent methyltransferase
VTDGDHGMTRAFYEAAAGTYARWVGTEIAPATETAGDRAVLAAFADLVATGPGGGVADVGCGTGRVAGYLAARDLTVIGMDLSAAMLAAARRAHPAIPFVEGRLDALPVADRSLGGVVCWYSWIHTPPSDLDAVAAEVARVLAAGGHLLVAFQAGAGEALHRAEAHGTGLPLTNWRHDPDDVARRLAAAGLAVRARTVRQAELAHESTPQAFLLAHPST